MALRASVLGLSRRFFSTPSMPWIRSMSTNAKDSSAPTDLADNVMPSLFNADLSVPKELSTSLEPYAGRSIGNVANPNVAYRKLNSILAQNNVRRELRANMYYEKPAVARRRQRRERNQKLFGAMIKKKVALIMQMKQRGM
ncbi:uncharacterized protein BYT42DRAFT_580010 [Radiomyces spectabilis]|uniref:uncharacterized protein n=1 Tax=Radiomyces spectabilis TaxID=64574 RepID=UPI002220D5FF|nr:uncharacterized protein BYT42DRAFT_580010 [Radiomyces spectabilis]KAI8371372.1 hypothetical protein BYT42DRAFT_580010 [Radiomyces spectabilis]